MCVICETFGYKNALEFFEREGDEEGMHTLNEYEELISHLCEATSIDDPEMIAVILTIGRLLGKLEIREEPFSNFLENLSHE